VPAEQAFVQQRRVPLREHVEVGDGRVGRDVMADDLGPGPGDRRVELLRCVAVSCRIQSLIRLDARAVP